MKTYTEFNISSMKDIIDAIECLPESYDLRNEAVCEVGYDGDKLVMVRWSGVSMRLVDIHGLGLVGWMIGGSDGVWLKAGSPEEHAADALVEVNSD